MDIVHTLILAPASIWKAKMLKPLAFFLLLISSFPGAELCCRNAKGLTKKEIANIMNIKDVEKSDRLLSSFCSRPTPAPGNRCCEWTIKKFSTKKKLFSNHKMNLAFC